jgi:hypothetical protein
MADRKAHSGGRRPRETGSGEEAVEAWRTAEGHGLIVFLPGGDRALLEDARGLADLSDGEVAELRERAVPLTLTEAVFAAPDGRRWLAQATGPAWSSEAAPGILGTRFTSLEGRYERFDAAGTPLTVPAVDSTRRERELLSLWRTGGGAHSEGAPPEESGG